MPDPSIRQRRVSDTIAQQLGVILQQRSRDPRLEGLVITGVRVSKDLSQATVFVSSMTDLEQGEALDALRHSAAFLRTELADRVRLRFVPQLTFQWDDTYDQANRIENLLDEVARDLRDSGGE